MVDYLFFSTICFNKLISSKLISYMLIGNIQGQHHSWNVKFTCNWRDFELQVHGFLQIVSKGKMCITSHNPLWRSMVYRRIMTAKKYYRSTEDDIYSTKSIYRCDGLLLAIYIQCQWVQTKYTKGSTCHH